MYWLTYGYNYNYRLFLFEVLALDMSVKATVIMTDIIFDGRRYPSYTNVDLLKIHRIHKTDGRNAIFVYAILRVQKKKHNLKKWWIYPRNNANCCTVQFIRQKKMFFFNL